MKTIIIKGKHQQEQINNVKCPKRIRSIDFTDADLLIKTQLSYILKLYMDVDFTISKFIKRELEIKLNGYKTQDKNKKIYDINKIISLDSIIERLIESRLNCYYCNCDTHILYDNVRQQNQWTLDRIDNNIGHNTNNVVIACLECNLKRKRINIDRFKFSKKCIHINKIDYPTN